ncbi:MAG TPA: hypothetical protein V6D13_10140 [Halomicronema sp.]
MNTITRQKTHPDSTQLDNIALNISLPKRFSTSIPNTADFSFPLNPIARKPVLRNYERDLQASAQGELIKQNTPKTKQDKTTKFADNSLLVDPRGTQPFDWVKTTDAYQRIIHLLDLQENWDGYNAPKFSQEQINIALSLYYHIRTYCNNRSSDFSKIEPFIAPGSDGSILFEWAGKRFPVRKLEIYVPHPLQNPLEYLKTEGNYEEEDVFNLDNLSSILDWLFQFSS